jgi:beta-lactamase superfamily II metal-dependent hydrolase
MRIFPGLMVLLCLSLPAPAARTLDFYFIDVEGGQATLIVTPAGQSMLVDAGWPGNNGRDADRIAAALRHAGLKKIDYLLVTHYHTDHVGGVPQLLAKTQVTAVIDHGMTPAEKAPTRSGRLRGDAMQRIVLIGDALLLRAGDQSSAPVAT